MKSNMPMILSPQSNRELGDMQKKYESPEVEVIALENRDIIVSSGPLPGDNEFKPEYPGQS